MDCAAVLLTGGSSRRMGSDKAALEVPAAGPDRSPVSLARRTAGLLQAVSPVTVEVGPGLSGLPAVREEPAGAGPLAAIAAGAAALAAAGWDGPALVVATDLPRLTGGVLRWLARHQAPACVVPVKAGRVQPLCARYDRSALVTAAELVAGGRRAVHDLLSAAEVHLAPEAEWVGPAGDPAALDDADTPAELARLVGGARTARAGGPRR